jgi:hypothetical protein
MILSILDQVLSPVLSLLKLDDSFSALWMIESTLCLLPVVSSIII